MPAPIAVHRSTLADGRELLYFDDEDTTLGADRAVDARELAPRPPTPELRRDPLTGDWISVAPARQNRVVLPPARLDPLAPQSPGNPSEIPATYDVAVFENRSPSFGPDLDDGIPPHREGFALGRVRAATGRCEVVCFSPDSHGSFGTQTPSRARTVIEAWAHRTAELSALPGIEQVFVFENRGEAIGVTLGHPHGQIYAYPYVAPRTLRTIAMAREAGDEGGDLFDRILAFERSSDRLVLAGEHWTAFVPFAARWPIELHVVPNRRVPDFAATTDEERAELAPVYLRLLRAIDRIYDSPTPYIAAWHQAPVRDGRHLLRLHLQLTSPRRSETAFKFLAGSEAALGAWIADGTAEAAAERWRIALARVDEEMR